VRAFIAIEISDEARQLLVPIQGQLKKTGADIKWVKPENIHLTLKFLGDITNEQTGAVSCLLDNVARQYNKFDMTLFKIGAFPKLDFPKVIWVGIDNKCAVIEEIASRVTDACQEIGFEREKRHFSSHITIGRLRSSKNKAGLKKEILDIDVPRIVIPVDSIILFQSTLTPQGPIYTKVHAGKLL